MTAAIPAEFAGVRWITPAVLEDHAAAAARALARATLESKLDAATRGLAAAWGSTSPEPDRIDALGARVAALRAALEPAPTADTAPSLRHVFEAACTTLQRLGAVVFAIEPVNRLNIERYPHQGWPEAERLAAEEYEGIMEAAGEWARRARGWMQAEQLQTGPDLREAERLAAEGEALVARGHAAMKRDPDVAGRRNVRRNVMTLFGAKREVLAASLVVPA